MLGLDGKWLVNSNCKKCKHRHPAGWACNYAAFVAARNKVMPNTKNFYFRETTDPWEHFIKENYP